MEYNFGIWAIPTDDDFIKCSGSFIKRFVNEFRWMLSEGHKQNFLFYQEYFSPMRKMRCDYKNKMGILHLRNEPFSLFSSLGENFQGNLCASKHRF